MNKNCKNILNDRRKHSILFLSGLYTQKIVESRVKYKRNIKHKGKGYE